MLPNYPMNTMDATARKFRALEQQVQDIRQAINKTTTSVDTNISSVAQSVPTRTLGEAEATSTGVIIIEDPATRPLVTTYTTDGSMSWVSMDENNNILVHADTDIPTTVRWIASSV